MTWSVRFLRKNGDSYSTAESKSYPSRATAAMRASEYQRAHIYRDQDKREYRVYLKG